MLNEMVNEIQEKILKEKLLGDIHKQIKDKDFDGVKNYFTPKKFLESMSMKTYDTGY